MGTLFIVCLALAYSVGVSAHAGLVYPEPTGALCDADAENSTCALLTAPCGDLNITSYATILRGPYQLSTIQVSIYQKVSYYNAANYYQIGIWNEDSSQYDTYGTFYQGVDVNRTGEGVVTLTLNIASIPSISVLKTTLQMIFNATAGGGSVYYSCAGIWVNPPCADYLECAAIGEECADPANDGSIFRTCDVATSYCNDSVCVPFDVGAPCFGICDIPSGGSDFADSLFFWPTLFCNMTSYPGVCLTSIVAELNETCDDETNSAHCTRGTYCNSDKICESSKLLGEECNITAHCVPSLYCNYTGQCDLFYSKTEGQQCTLYQTDCIPGLVCNDTDGSGGYCITPVSGQGGHLCSYTSGQSNCSVGYVCACSEYDADTQECVLTADLDIPCQTQIDEYHSCMLSKQNRTWEDCLAQTYCLKRCSAVEAYSVEPFTNPLRRCFTAEKCLQETPPLPPQPSEGIAFVEFFRVYLCILASLCFLVLLH